MAIIKPEQLRSGSYSISGSFSGSFQGLVSGTSSNAVSASYAFNATSASNALTASYVQNAQTASYVQNAVSASYAALAQTANTASYVENAQTASYVLQAVSASFATNAQNAQTASYVENAQTASYVLNAVSASYAVTSSYSVSSSYALNATSASNALTASYLNTLNQNLTFNGNLTLNGTASIGTLIVNQTSLSTGSNQLGDAADDTQTLYGTVVIPTGSLTVTGSVRSTGGFTGSFSGSVTAPGSTTQIIYNNGGVLGADSGFVYNGSSVGIGTTPSSYRLDVQGSNGGALLRIKDTDSSYEGISISGDASGGYVGNGSAGSFKESIYFQDSINAVRLFTSGSERVRITSTGNTSIGTSTSSARLQVRGTGTTSATTALRVENTNASASLVVLDNGFVGINTGSSAFNLDVNGTTRITGTGTTSATTALTITNSSGATYLQARNDGSLIGTTLATTVGAIWGLASYIAFQGRTLALTGTSGGGGDFLSNSFNLSTNASFSGTINFSRFNNSFTHNGTGNQVANFVTIDPTINQTGGAPGITRGLFISPTLTAAADFRAIEWSNNTGFGLYGIGGATNYLSGSLGIGTTTPSYKLDISGSGNFSNDLTVTGSLIAGSTSVSSLTASNATISGNVTVLGTASINSLIVNQIGYSSGSNQLGDAADDTQTLYGTVVIPTGSLTVSGSTYSRRVLIGNDSGSSAQNDFYHRATNGGVYFTIRDSNNNSRLYFTGQSGTSQMVAVSQNIGLGVYSPTSTNRVTIGGIGTTSATTALRVENSNASASLVITDDGASTFTAQSNATPITITGYVATGSATQPALDITGSWNTSGIPTLIRANVTNTTSNANSLLMDLQVGGSSRFRVLNNGAAQSLLAYYVGPSISSTAGITAFNPKTNTSTLTSNFNVGVRLGDFRDTTSEGYSYLISSTQYTDLAYTGSIGGFVNIARGYAPTSGTGVFNVLSLENTINQTGGANGITRGLYVNPTLTAAADFRAIEWSNNTGFGLYGAGTAPNHLNGNLSVGQGPSFNTVLIRRTLSGSVASSVTSDRAIDPSVTTAIGFRSRLYTAASTFNITELSHFKSEVAVLYGGATITNNYGFHVTNELTTATNNYGFFGNMPSGTGRWNLFMNGTADNALQGNTGIGLLTSPSSRLQVRGSGATSATTTLRIENSSASPSLTITDDLNSQFFGNVGVRRAATASLDIAGTTRISGSFNTAASGSILTVIGSGSAQPIFTVQGSQGELFSITDSLTGSLFSVNDISGLPILEVFSDNTTLIGNYQDPMLITTAKVVQTNSGSFTVYSLPTASYDTAFFEYSIKSGSNARAGTIMAIQLGSTVNFTETTTTDFGDTTAVSFTVIITGSNMALTGSSTTGSWTTKCIVRGL